jgi:hypothetical protein
MTNAECLGWVTANDVNTSCHQPAAMPPMADDAVSHMFRHIGETYDNCQCSGRVTVNDVNTSCHQPAVMPPMADDAVSHMFRHIGETYDNC